MDYDLISFINNYSNKISYKKNKRICNKKIEHIDNLLFILNLIDGLIWAGAHIIGMCSLPLIVVSLVFNLWVALLCSIFLISISFWIINHPGLPILTKIITKLKIELNELKFRGY